MIHKGIVGYGHVRRQLEFSIDNLKLKEAPCAQNQTLHSNAVVVNSYSCFRCSVPYMHCHDTVKPLDNRALHEHEEAI